MPATTPGTMPTTLRRRERMAENRRTAWGAWSLLAALVSAFIIALHQRDHTAMSGANTFKFVMLPPQSDTARGWGRRLAEALPEVRVVIAEDQATAEREIVDAEAAFGRLPRDLLAKAQRLRWLQAPQIAPPAGYYYPELID